MRQVCANRGGGSRAPHDRVLHLLRHCATLARPTGNRSCGSGT